MPDLTPSTTEAPIPSTESPPTPASPSPDQPSPSDDFGFEGGGRGGDLDESSLFTELDEVPPAPAAPTAQPPASQPTAPVPPSTAQPAAQPPQQPSSPTTQPAPDQQVDPQQVVQAFQQWRQNAEHVLSNSHYNLSQEDANQINIDPGQVIPKLMSRVYLDAVTAAVNVIAQALPYTVMNTIDAHNGYQKNEDEFFGEWPGLKDHHAEVIRTGQVFRHLNPKASKADFIRSVGAQVAMSLGLTAEQARGAAARQVASAGQRVLRHIPPAASARHMATPPRTPANIFEQMAQDTAEDD